MHDSAFNPRDVSELNSAVDYFENHPPRKQKLDEHKQLSWSDPLKRKDELLLIWLLRMIRTVRNNLFHGGKFPLLPISDPSSNRELLIHAMTSTEPPLKSVNAVLTRETEFGSDWQPKVGRIRTSSPAIQKLAAFSVNRCQKM